MFDDYQAAIVEYYQLKRANGSLSTYLITPKPSNIKRACLFVLEKGVDKRDLETLQLFIGEKENEVEYRRALRSSDASIFRPLSNFLKGETVKPEEQVIELLAWLVDFTPRPYKPGFSASQVPLAPMETTSVDIGKGKELTEDEARTTSGGEIAKIDTPGDTEGEPPTNTPIKLTSKYKGAIISLSVAIAIAMGSFIFHNYNKQCMYWNGYKYVAVDCDVSIHSAEVIAVNEAELNDLKWITNADTISAKHINKIWYIRNDNMVELFTIGGQYPPDRKRRLFLLSKTIYNKYVVTGRVRVK